MDTLFTAPALLIKWNHEFIESCITYQHFEIAKSLYLEFTGKTEVPHWLEDSRKKDSLPFSAPLIRMSKTIEKCLIAGFCKINVPAEAAVQGHGKN